MEKILRAGSGMFRLTYFYILNSALSITQPDICQAGVFTAA